MADYEYVQRGKWGRLHNCVGAFSLLIAGLCFLFAVVDTDPMGFVAGAGPAIGGVYWLLVAALGAGIHVRGGQAELRISRRPNGRDALVIPYEAMTWVDVTRRQRRPCGRWQAMLDGDYFPLRGKPQAAVRIRLRDDFRPKGPDLITIGIDDADGLAAFLQERIRSDGD